MVSEWQVEARDPILKCIVSRGYFDTFQVEDSFLTGKKILFQVGCDKVVGDLEKWIATKEGMSEFTIFRLQFHGTIFSADTPIAATGIEQGNQIHCIPKLPEGC
jgi:hypothetical protein